MNPRNGSIPTTKLSLLNCPLNIADVIDPKIVPNNIYTNCKSADSFLLNVTFASTPNKLMMLDTNEYVDVAEPNPLLFDSLVGSWRQPTRAPDIHGGHDF